MDIRTIRKANFAILVKQAGGKAKLARRLGMDPNYLSQIKSEPDQGRAPGFDLCRKMEEGMGKPRGWCDVDHSQANVGEGRVARSEAVTVPLLSWAQVGRGMGDGGALKKSEAVYIYTGTNVGHGAFGLKVRGESMVDTSGGTSYPDGAVIVVDPTLEAEPGDDVVVLLSTAAEAVFKRLDFDGEKKYLKPLNSRYPIAELPADAKILGVVVQVQIEVKQRFRSR